MLNTDQLDSRLRNAYLVSHKLLTDVMKQQVVDVSDDDSEIKIRVAECQNKVSGQTMMRVLLECMSIWKDKDYTKMMLAKTHSPIGMVIKFTHNNNGHNYGIDVPVLCVSAERALRPDGIIGNTIPTNGWEVCDEEVMDAFYFALNRARSGEGYREVNSLYTNMPYIARSGSASVSNNYIDNMLKMKAGLIPPAEKAVPAKKSAAA